MEPQKNLLIMWRLVGVTSSPPPARDRYPIEKLMSSATRKVLLFLWYTYFGFLQKYNSVSSGYFKKIPPFRKKTRIFRRTQHYHQPRNTAEYSANTIDPSDRPRSRRHRKKKKKKQRPQKSVPHYASNRIVESCVVLRQTRL